MYYIYLTHLHAMYMGVPLSYSRITADGGNVQHSAVSGNHY